MAVTLDQLQTALGLPTDDDDIDTIVQRIMDAGDAIITEVANSAPDDIKDQALVMFAHYVYDQPPAPEGELHADAWRFSGAEALVQPWFAFSTSDSSDEADAFDALVALRAPNAPTAVKTLAKKRYRNYLKAIPFNANGAGAWTRSGAAGILSPWVDARYASDDA